jgi:hypothetical protein
MDFKTGSMISYKMLEGRHSGEAMTSFGNSLNNISMTRSVYNLANISKDLVGAIILGDDNLSIMKGIPETGLADKISGFFKKAGFEAKVKVSTHIAKAEYCSMWFAPVLDRDG